MLISLIIPVYNVEEYIERCLVSCIAQDLSSEEYEIIIINDGTQDNSVAIVEKYQKLYPCLIHFISQENQGLSAARNAGLSLAQGIYVWFIDSDDYIENNCLARIIASIRSSSFPDLLQIQYRLVYDDIFQNTDADKFLVTGVITGCDVMRRGGLPNPAQFTLYRKQFLLDNNLSFVKGLLHEDTEFKPRVTYLAESIASFDMICYNYYQRKTGSITSRFTMKNAVNIVKVLNSLYDFSLSMPMVNQKYFNCFIGLNMNTLLFGIRCLSKNEKQSILKILSENRKLFRRMFFSVNKKYVLEGLVFLFSIRLGYSVYLCLKK